MTPNADILPRLDELLAALADDALSTAQTAELERIVLTHPEARLHYLRVTNLNAALRWVAENDGSQWPVASGQRVASGEWRVASEGEYPQIPKSPNPQIPELPVFNFQISKSPNLQIPLPSPLSSLPSAWAFSYMVATIVLGVMLLSAWAYKISHDYGPSFAKNSSFTKNNRGLTAPGGPAPRPPDPVFVGRVTGMKDCRWADPATETVAGAYVPLGRKYALASGLMEITYSSGAKVILEGPCSYQVESPAGGFLSLGKLTAKVERGEGRGERGEKSEVGGQRSEATTLPSPFGRGAGGEGSGNQSQSALTLTLSKRERGPNPNLQISKSPNSKSSPLSTLPSPLFTVRTPTAVVTDLGTEFGVEVSPDGKTDAFVLDGVVRVSATSPTAKNRTLICRAGELVRVEPGNSGVRAIEPEKDFAQRFARAMPRAVDKSQAYKEYVLSLNPAVYYRMEKPRGDAERYVVFDSAGSGRHGELRLGDEYGGPPYREGRFGDALSLRGPDAGDRVIVPDYPKTINDQLTVSAWVMATGRPGWAMIAANWGHAIEGQFHLGLFQRDGDLAACVRQRDGQRIIVREGADRPLPTFVWHHVALVADGNVLRLYRNGKQVASTACAGLCRETPLPGLGIGCTTNDAGTDSFGDVPGHYYWQGRTDELAIFHEALSEVAIRQLYLGKKVNGRTEASSVGKGDMPMDGH